MRRETRTLVKQKGAGFILVSSGLLRNRWFPKQDLNWNNSGDIRIFFGTDASGLTTSQLNQIAFFNPGGFPAGNYPAQILSTGEIIPSARLAIAMTSSPDALVLSWTGNYQRLSATNVQGPYLPVRGATNPFTSGFLDPRRFFLLGPPAP